MEMNLTEHFTMEEATATHQRDAVTGLLIPNEPGPAEREALVNTFKGMELVRSIFGRPVSVHSAFRSHVVNAMVGGSPSSQHEKGEAVDFVVPGVPLRDAFLKILKSDVPFDQLIEEAGAWIHISFVSRRPERRQALVMRVVSGRAHYEPFKESAS
jgi:zinc D-Ala-D-Ala carboxypeptidase